MHYWILGAFLLSLPLGAFCLAWWMRGAHKRSAASLARELGDVRHMSPAHYRGAASRHPEDFRGLGHLALTPDELVFRMILPRRELRVLRTAIRVVEAQPAKTGRSSILKLEVASPPKGEEDSWSFAVRDADRWQAVLSS